MSEVEKYIKSIPDFPQPGIIFRDVTSVTEDPEGMKLAIDEMDKLLEEVDYDVIAGAESEDLYLEHRWHTRTARDLFS